MKKKIFSLLLCIPLLLSVNSCSDNGIIYDGEYIMELKYKLYESKIADQNNFIGFIADKEDLRYTTANNLINNYAKFYNNLSIYRLDITKNENDYFDKTIKEENLVNLSNQVKLLGCNDLINSLLLYQNGVIYRAINFSDIIYQENTQEALYNYINNFYNYSVSITAEIEENTTELINISAEQTKEKIDNLDSFMLFVGQEQCSSCISCKQNLNTYIQNTNKKIYLLNLKKGDYQFLKNELGINVKYTPTFYTFKEGKLVNLYIGCYNDSQLNAILKNESQPL